MTVQGRTPGLEQAEQRLREAIDRGTRYGMLCAVLGVVAIVEAMLLALR